MTCALWAVSSVSTLAESFPELVGVPQTDTERTEGSGRSQQVNEDLHRFGHLGSLRPGAVGQPRDGIVQDSAPGISIAVRGVEEVVQRDARQLERPPLVPGQQPTPRL